MSGFRSLVAWWIGGAWGPSIDTDRLYTDADAVIVDYYAPTAEVVDTFEVVQATADGEPVCEISSEFIVTSSIIDEQVTAIASRI